MQGILMKDYFLDLVIKGEKTQTRRIIKIPKVAHPSATINDIEFHEGTSLLCAPHIPHKNGCWFEIKPKYKVGEIYYIKENHIRYNYPNKDAVIKHYDNLNLAYHRTESTQESLELIIPDAEKLEASLKIGYKKRGKMIMPAFAARHFIKITEIRVERLRDINDEDCFKEGIKKHKVEWDDDEYDYSSPYHEYERSLSPQSAFMSLINEIDGKGTWDSNPYVFVYEFEYILNP